MAQRHEDGSCALTKSQVEDKFKSIAQAWSNQQSAADSSMGDGKGRGPMDLMAMALHIAGAESNSQASTSPGKTADVLTPIDENHAASASESSTSSLSDRGIAMPNAPKTQRHKVKTGSAHKTGGVNREATVPVKPKTGPKVITGFEPRQTLGASYRASGAMASGAKAPDAEKAEHRKSGSLTVDGRSKKALQTMEQDLSDAAKEVAELPEDLTGLVGNESLLGEGTDFAEQLKKQGRDLIDPWPP